MHKGLLHSALSQRSSAAANCPLSPCSEPLVVARRLVVARVCNAGDLMVAVSNSRPAFLRLLPTACDTRIPVTTNDDGATRTTTAGSVEAARGEDVEGEHHEVSITRRLPFPHPADLAGFRTQYSYSVLSGHRARCRSQTGRRQPERKGGRVGRSSAADFTVCCPKVRPSWPPPI